MSFYIGSCSHSEPKSELRRNYLCLRYLCRAGKLGYAQPVKANAIMRLGFISPSLSRPYFVRPWPGWLIRVLLQRVLGYRLASRFATKPSVASRSQPNFEHPVRQCRVRSWDNYPAGPSVEFLSVSPASGLFRVWPPSYQEAL
jgi:hypothetical protein